MTEKDELLLRVLAGKDTHLRTELLRRIRGETATRPRAAGRTVAHLLDAAERHRDEREQRAAQERRREQGERERVAAAARTRRLDTLAAEGEGPWRKVMELIDTKKISQYDVAVTLLGDLQDLAGRDGGPGRLRPARARTPCRLRRPARTVAAARSCRATGPVGAVPPSGTLRWRRYGRSMWPRVSELEQRINEFMDRVHGAGEDHRTRAAALEDYLRFAYVHADDDQFDIGAWSGTLAESYLALGLVEDAVRVVEDATSGGFSEGAEMLCNLAEKLMRGGHQAPAHPLWDQARAQFPDDVWVYVQAGMGYSDLGEHATALSWLTSGVELALRTGDVESALDQLTPLRAECLSVLGQQPDDLQVRARRATRIRKGNT